MNRFSRHASLCLCMTCLLSCDYFETNAELRNAMPKDTKAYFDDDDLRVATLTACHAGNPKQQAAWAALRACSYAEQVDAAKRRGWHPD